jgi:tRNA-dihydrouridine synthase
MRYFSVYLAREECLMKKRETDRSYYGEYDNYNYRTADEMTLEERIELAHDALDAAISLSQSYKNGSWDDKIIEIKQHLEWLEQQKEENKKWEGVIHDKNSYEKIWY